MPIGDRRDRVEIRRVEARAGRIVRIADDDELRPVRGEALQARDINAPRGPRTFGQRPFLDARAERPREAPHLPVRGHHHHDLVVALDEIPRRDVVRFGAAVGDLHVVRRRARVLRRDEQSERRRPVRLRVPQRFLEQALTRRSVVDEVAEPQRLHAAFREIEGHLVLVGGLHPLHRELFKFHRRPLYRGSCGEQVIAPGLYLRPFCF